MKAKSSINANILAMAMAISGIIPGIVGLSQYRPTVVNLEVVPNHLEGIRQKLANPSKAVKQALGNERVIRLSLKNPEKLPQFETAKVIHKDTIPGINPYGLWIASSIFLGGSAAFYHRRTQHLKKMFLPFVGELNNTINQALALEQEKRELLQIEQNLRQPVFEEIGNALSDSNTIPLPLAPRDEDQINHVKALQEQARDAEILAAKAASIEAMIRVKELEAKLAQAGKPPKKLSPKKELIRLMKEHEGGWIYSLLSGSRPLFFIGGQGSGKTTTATAMVLIRQLVFGQTVKIVADIHGHRNYAKNWSKILKISPETQLVGADIDKKIGDDWDGYLTAFYGMVEFLNTTEGLKDNEASNTAHHCSIWDELTKGRVEAEKSNTLEKFTGAYISLLTASRKAAHAPIILTHILTSASVPDKLWKTIREASSQIRLGNNLDASPTLSGHLEYLENDKAVQVPITIPPWLNPPKILEMFEVE